MPPLRLRRVAMVTIILKSHARRARAHLAFMNGLQPFAPVTSSVTVSTLLHSLLEARFWGAGAALLPTDDAPKAALAPLPSPAMAAACFSFSPSHCEAALFTMVGLEIGYAPEHRYSRLEN